MKKAVLYFLYVHRDVNMKKEMLFKKKRLCSEHCGFSKRQMNYLFKDINTSDCFYYRENRQWRN